VTCADCTHDAEHCHGTLVLHPDGTVECTDLVCTELGRERHDLVLVLPAD
jgi:hypothetical protein